MPEIPVNLNDLQEFDPTIFVDEKHANRFGCINLNALPSLYRGSRYITDRFMIKVICNDFGGKLLKKVTRVFSGRFNGDNGADGEFLCPSSARALIFEVELKGRKVVFVYCSLGIYCKREDLYDILNTIPVLAKRYRPKQEKKNNRDLLHSLHEMLEDLYNNESIIAELYTLLAPYVSTFALRRKFKINMNLSIVLSGMPGDGKTYAAVQIAKWMKENLDMPIAEGSLFTFEKAAKLADDFIGVVDDMVIGHFQRNGPYQEYCECMLAEMDRTGTNRLFILTTNEVLSRENVDAAFFRPGRIQGIVNFTRPNQDVKAKFWRDLKQVLQEHGYTIDNNTFTGLNMVFEESKYSLAQLFRAKNLIIQDFVLNNCLDTPAQYLERSSPIAVAATKDEASDRIEKAIARDAISLFGEDFEDYDNDDEDDENEDF